MHLQSLEHVLQMSVRYAALTLKSKPLRIRAAVYLCVYIKVLIISFVFFLCVQNLRLSSRVLTDFGTDVLSTSNENGSFSTSWLRNLSTASDSWRSNSMKSTKLHNDFDNFHYHAQPSPIPASVLQLAGSSYLLRATAWEHYGRYLSVFC